MVRKKIGDLLREEAQQPVEREGAPVTAENNDKTNLEENEVSELQPVNIPAHKSKRGATTEAETNVDELKKLLQSAQKTESSLQAQITEVDELKKLLQIAQKTESSLQAQIAEVDELKKLLQTAQKTESSLQAQITDLKSQLHDQKQLMKELETQSTHEKELKTALEEAKKTILKLAEVSSKPTAKAGLAKQESKQLVQSKSTRTEKLPNYSDPSERPNTTLGNKDIGWFD